MNKLTREFYNRDTLDVAKELLGKHLIIIEGNKSSTSKIVETEGYIGSIDKAAHSYQNKRTPRTEVMFGPPGYAYVYLIYGMYYCLNIVTEAAGESAAVLIRAVEPISGVEEMSIRRYKKTIDQLNRKEISNLTSGPGKLCMALGINKSHNGMDMCGDSIYLTYGSDEEHEIVTSKRINIDYAEEAVDYPWRFYIKDNPFVSK
ncbi:DNA-3-methyladenine glycosylase [Alkaliphilus peptidifermentans]|uniref:Putative 3-methyladenine DNA glycosylase n=1 Tax=Alkaliphilus peptidifermentans DSM 18978 TaxID=1120976 RepID=A0A1G5CGV4_9FIRM|nr:DNA-3-methyladenine glycosylase [Alkaliphilus peptidifermentans]SCY01528.1 DNA-3-methyladenine glycosylase [Alkaliphilus peptidifermentans DSM 18978]